MTSFLKALLLVSVVLGPVTARSATLEEFHDNKVAMNVFIAKDVAAYRAVACSNGDDARKAACNSAFDTVTKRLEGHVAVLDLQLKAADINDPQLRAQVSATFDLKVYVAEHTATQKLLSEAIAIFTPTTSVGQSTPTLKARPATLRQKK